MEQENLDDDDDVRRFVLAVTKQRVEYLNYVKSRGYAVDDEQIAGFEEEIRTEEARLGESDNDLICQDHIEELQRQLAYVDIPTERNPKYIKVLLLRLEHSRLIMRVEQNHQRPHFHIEYKKQYSASYAVDTLERLAGNMPKKYEGPMLEWATKHQLALAATWDSLKAGQDVRELVIVAQEAPKNRA